MALKYPCTDCDTRRAYAILFDVQISGDDCPYDCEPFKAWAKECDEDTGDGVGQAFSPD